MLSRLLPKAAKPPSVTGQPVLAVCADPAGEPGLRRAAAQLAAELNLPYVVEPVGSTYEMLLVAAVQGLELRLLSGDATTRGLPLRADWERLDTESGAGRSFKQPLAKAVGLRGQRDLPLTVLDATAGWGKDTWLLAALGCRVLAVERSPVVAALLHDARTRAGARRPEVVERIQIVTADARELLRQIMPMPGARGSGHRAEARGLLRPDVVYLDPMFPGAAKRKTAEPKALRVLRRLVGADEDAAELFEAALRVAGKRVVVKRPAKGGLDFGRKPSATHAGKSFCFDVYLPER